MFHEFLEAVSEDVKEGGDKNKVKEFFSQHISGKGSQENQKEMRTKLVKALDNEEFDGVLKLIVEDNGENAKTLKTLNDNAKAIAQRERKRTAGLCHCVQGCRDCSKQEIEAFLQKCCKTSNACNFSCCCQNEQQDTENRNRANSMQPRSGECSKEQPKENFNEDEREWIKILSNPLYISLEWFRRIYTKPSGNEAGEGKENEEEDVIVAALRDSHLLQTIAGNDIHQHKKEYQKRAEIIEEFAKAVVEESTCEDELHDIMDTQGKGCLKQGEPENFIQSLSVLKIATDLERMKVCIFTRFLKFRSTQATTSCYRNRYFIQCLYIV